MKINDLQRVLLGDLMVRSIICKKTNIKNQNIVFQTASKGKPFLKNRNNIQFNISHSGDWVVCAFSRKAVGIDIERIKPANFEIAERFFSKAEYEALLKKSENERVSFFFDLWTFKERYIKAIGRGLSKSLSSFTVFNENNTYKIKLDKRLSKFYLKQYSIDKNYKMAVCSLENNYIENVNIETIHSIIEYL